MRPRCREVGVLSPRLIALCVTVATLLGASSLSAQSGRGIAPAVDSSAVANSWPQRAWIGGGLGAGFAPGGTVSAIATGWYSAGFVALGVRAVRLTDPDALFAQVRRDLALLVGGRTRGNRSFSSRRCRDRRH